MTKTSMMIASLIPVLAAAQSTDQKPAEEDAGIEEITVIGARSLGSMRTDVARAEQVVYDLFNQLNDDDAYDIICKKEAVIGSQIRKRVCMPRIYRDAISEATVDGDAAMTTVGPMVSKSKVEEALRSKMSELANEHPELLQALLQRKLLQKKFQAERARRYEE